MTPLTEDPAMEVCLRISAHSGTLTEDPEFTEFIEHGAARLTPRSLAQLVSEMPEVREKLLDLQKAGFLRTHDQVAFLADVVDGSALQDPLFWDLPCRAILEAAFALQYFHRAIDLVPDSLSTIGYTDDAAVVATVIARNGEGFKKLAVKLRQDWEAISPEKSHPR